MTHVAVCSSTCSLQLLFSSPERGLNLTFISFHFVPDVAVILGEMLKLFVRDLMRIDLCAAQAASAFCSSKNLTCVTSHGVWIRELDVVSMH